MNRKLNSNKHRHAWLISLGIALAAACTSGQAATTELADLPLANSTTATILPNIFFVLDDSGSMDDAHMPPYVAISSLGSYCRGISGGKVVRKACRASTSTFSNSEPPYYASAFNGLFYNPLVDYVPPPDCATYNVDGSCKSKTSYTGMESTGVPNDAYGVQDTGKTKLTTAFPETVACTGSSYSAGTCRPLIDTSASPAAYSYPNGTYKNLVAKTGAPFYYNVTVQWCTSVETTGDKIWGKSGTCQTKKDSTHQYVLYTNWSRVDIVPTVTSYPGPNGTTRTYAQELGNFANWYAWYHTRLQMAKTSIALAFKDVRGTPDSTKPDDSQYFHARVGFSVISDPSVSGTKFLSIDNFDPTQKTSFYSKLYSIATSGWTPLRAALAKAGQIYAHTIANAADPVQYSCQRNFTILATDGGWNTVDEVTGSYGPYRMDGKTAVGDCDGSGNCGVDKANITRPELDKLAVANTLADVAYYYYHTDLRPGTCSPDKCTDNVPPAGSNPNSPVDDVAQWQHMTTFTVGLGVDGTLAYKDNYKTSTSGDYFDITQGTKDWPDPTKTLTCGDDCPGEKIDDLWHAAVNGRGTYFSARDPKALEEGLVKALGSMKSSIGSGAAAATSNLQPTSGDNFIYVATYRTLQWDGELSAFTVDLNTGTISSTPSWQANSSLQSQIAAAGNSDTRTIYTANGTTRTSFIAGSGGLTAAQQAFFDNSLLSQSADWSADQKAAATTTQLVNYLRGQDRYEDQDRDVAYGTYQRLYRDRQKILGDIVHSQPIYVKAPIYGFTDSGYNDFKTAQANRAGTVYAAANDGMLHAFDSKDGTERWAYVPPIVLPQMWRLADSNYGNNHRYFLDGTLTINDAKVNGSWATVLIGALGKGGRGYYALDITDATNPKPLWNFTADDNNNVGYSYGMAHITKLKNGTWVAVVTSGYDNIPEGGKYAGADGKGYVFVLNLTDGSVLKSISTGEGSTGTPSGLARLNVRTEDFTHDNSETGAYGGDLLGNMWRFDLDAGTVRRISALGSGKPIMVAPEIGDVNGKQMVFFGSGRYLGKGDLADTSTQSIFGIWDDGKTTITSTAVLQQQTLATSGSTRSIANPQPINWTTKFGWYIDLPDAGERVNIDPQLYFGTLLVSSTVPTASACQPGGYSWLYQLDFASGTTVIGASSNSVGSRFTSPIVGLTVAMLPNGTPVVYPISADGRTPDPTIIPISSSGAGGAPKRVIWREISN